MLFTTVVAMMVVAMMVMAMIMVVANSGLFTFEAGSAPQPPRLESIRASMVVVMVMILVMARMVLIMAMAM